MLHPSTKKLIDRLCEMTLQRKIDWVSGDQNDTLAYDTEGYRVILERAPPALVLCDALGSELERADEPALTATKHIDGSTYLALLETMRAEAARIARGTEDAIAMVLGGLDQDGDGIPDIPHPVELEDAPDGPIAHTRDDIEDSADEMAALPDGLNETLDEPEEDAIESHMPAMEAPVEPVDTEEASAPQTEDHYAMRAADIDVQPAEPMPEPETLAQTLAETAEIEPDQSGKVMTGAIAYNGFFSLPGGTIEQTTVKPPAKDTAKESEPAVDRFADEAAPSALANLQTTAPRPGHTLSLSGLASGNNNLVNRPGTIAFQTTQIANPLADTQAETAPQVIETGQEAEAVLPDPEPSPVISAQEQFAQPIAEETLPAQEEAMPETDTEVGPEAESEAEPQAPKRFNPWI